MDETITGDENTNSHIDIHSDPESQAGFFCFYRGPFYRMQLDSSRKTFSKWHTGTWLVRKYRQGGSRQAATGFSGISESGANVYWHSRPETF